MTTQQTPDRGPSSASGHESESGHGPASISGREVAVLESAREDPPPGPGPAWSDMFQAAGFGTIILVVHGTPGPQGSKRHVGNGIMIESSKKVRPWRDAIRSDAAAYMNGAPALDCPVAVEMVFTFARPKSHYRSGRNAHLLRDDAPIRPGSKSVGDVSKLARSTEDALTDAGVWKDDALVVEYLRLAKVYVGEDRDALSSPGALIRISPCCREPS